MNLNCWLNDCRFLTGLARKRALEPYGKPVANKIITHQIAGGMRTTIPIPLPKDARSRIDNEMLRINLAVCGLPYSQYLLIIETKREAIAVSFRPNDGVVVVVRSTKPNAPEAERAAVNIRDKPLDMRRNLRCTRQLRSVLLSTAK